MAKQLDLMRQREQRIAELIETVADKSKGFTNPPIVVIGGYALRAHVPFSRFSRDCDFAMPQQKHWAFPAKPGFENALQTLLIGRSSFQNIWNWFSRICRIRDLSTRGEERLSPRVLQKWIRSGFERNWKLCGRGGESEKDINPDRLRCFRYRCRSAMPKLYYGCFLHQ